MAKIIEMAFTKTQLIIASLVALIIFLFSLEIRTFGGYTIFILLMVGIIYFLLGRYIINALQHGKSYFLITVLIIVAIIIAIFAYGLNLVLENKKNVDAQWDTYRCKPYIMPFAGVFIGPKGLNPGSNFIQCMWDINRNFFNILISPFTEMIQLILDILKGLVSDVQNIRKIVSYLRSSVKSIVEDIYQRLYETYGRIAFIVKKVMRIFSKLFQVFENVFDVMLYSFYSLASMWNGPIGGLARGIGKVGKFFCFGKGTLLKLADGDQIAIENIQVGNHLANGIEITGKMIFDANGVEIYNYDGIIVSGEHLVLSEDGKWCRIADIPKASRIEYSEPFIYCLTTNETVIPITGNIHSKNGDNITYLFTDYQETDNKIVNTTIYKMILFFLNRGRIGIDNQPTDNEILKYQSWGFDAQNRIRMADDTVKILKDIQIGEQIRKGGKVIGKIELNGTDIILYHYGDNIISGTDIVLSEDGKWRTIYNVISKLSNENENKKIQKAKRKQLYHLITEHNLIETADGKLFRDYEQSNNARLNQRIDDYIEDYLNLYSC